ncbi:MAG TPA: inorganic diphosphatase [Rhodospirillaceae bacterium]|jgi:inorganic pyrophosphatase|nr:inorganic diphosphatase [Alphaproteobacteria bacterium]HBH26982.1 inorganic diphosphatase [Rhodospirillaceae bacterium]
MDITKISPGTDFPQEVHVVVENPAGAPPVKYEMDKASGALFVDRFQHTSMMYPGHYGFVPGTLSGDGDPTDVLVFTHLPILPGAVLPSRPVGVLMMEDDGGMDEKIIAVPGAKMFPAYEGLNETTDLPQIFLQQVEHFFLHYKDLEPGKWSKVIRWDGAEAARGLLKEALERARKA